MQEFKKRRQALANKLPTGSVAVVFAASVVLRNSDTEFPFRQNSNFYYLTGLEEPDAIMLLVKKKPKLEFILAVQAKDKTQEIWHGERIGPKKAQTEFKADKAVTLTELATKPKLPKIREVYILAATTAKQKKQIRAWWPQAKFKLLDPLLAELRLIKSAAELKILQKVATVSAKAHKILMQACKPGMHEYELQGLFYQTCLEAGCNDLAYPAIVAGGINACTLHYTKNRSRLKAKDILLVDAGGEFQNYAADITRSYPVNGKFSRTQKDLYELLLRSQQAGIAMVAPGNTFDMVQQAILEVLVPGLVALKILRGKVATLLAKGGYREVYMHSSGHWLGLDVHDVGAYKVNNKFRQFAPGMVLTVEPGVYLGKHCSSPAKYKGIGMRIEDTVAVTTRGVNILSKSVPKEIEEIEQLMH